MDSNKYYDSDKRDILVTQNNKSKYGFKNPVENASWGRGMYR